MRIVDVCAFYTPAGGGVQHLCRAQAEGGPAAGHEIVILAPGDEDAVIEESRPARSSRRSPRPHFPLDRNYHYFDDEDRCTRRSTDWRPDLVEVASPWTQRGDGRALARDRRRAR